MFMGNKKLRPYTSLHTLKLVYYSLAHPHLQYCISTWGGACKTTLQQLLTKQKIIIRCMLYQSYRAPSSPLFHKLSILKVDDVYKLSIAKLIIKLFNNHTIPQTLSTISNIHSHNTRHNIPSNLFIPTVTSNLGKTSFSHCGPTIWNNIPIEIRTSSIFSFKSKLKKHTIENYLTNT